MSPNSLRYSLWPAPSVFPDPEFVQESPNLFDSGDVPNLPARPTTVKAKTPPPATPVASAAEIDEQARMLKQYEDQQAALRSAQEDEARRRAELEAQQQREFEQRQLMQQEQERQALEQLRQQQTMQFNNQAADQVHALEREMLVLRGQFDRDQLMLEQYDRVWFPFSPKNTVLTEFGLLEGQGSRARAQQRGDKRWVTTGFQG